jgi:hypothetical protein
MLFAASRGQRTLIPAKTDPPTTLARPRLKDVSCRNTPWPPRPDPTLASDGRYPSDRFGTTATVPSGACITVTLTP